MARSQERFDYSRKRPDVTCSIGEKRDILIGRGMPSPLRIARGTSNMTDIPRRVRVVEVGPRDGLQNEKAIIATEDKLHFIALLNEAGFPEIEVTSFVSPKAIPQLADAGEVFPAVEKKPGTRYPVLVPNQRGMERALAADVQAIAVFTAA